MPRTAGLFLFGSMAICALPPLNGFISELLIYYGLFMGLHAGSVYQTISMLLTIIALALIGGFALFGFSKAFGLTFLGSPRSAVCFNEEAVTKGMLFPKLIIAFGILVIGLAPMLVLAPVLNMIGFQFEMGTEPLISSLGYNLSKVSVIGIVLIITVILVMLLRSRVVRPEKHQQALPGGVGIQPERQNSNILPHLMLRILRSLPVRFSIRILNLSPFMRRIFFLKKEVSSGSPAIFLVL